MSSLQAAGAGVEGEGRQRDGLRSIERHTHTYTHKTHRHTNKQSRNDTYLEKYGIAGNICAGENFCGVGTI